MRAAIRGNIGSKGAAGMGRVKSPHSETMRGGESVAQSGGGGGGYRGPRMSRAGLENDKSAYIQTNGTGYQRRSKPLQYQRASQPEAYLPPVERTPIFSRYDSIKSSITNDKAMSKLV